MRCLRAASWIGWLALPFLLACFHYAWVEEDPLEVVRREEPAFVRIGRVQGDSLTLATPRIVDGYLVGRRVTRGGHDLPIQDRYAGRDSLVVAAESIQWMEVRRLHSRKTLLALVTPPIGLVLIGWWVISQPNY